MRLNLLRQRVAATLVTVFLSGSLLIRHVLADDALLQYLMSGDLIGFVVSCYTSRIGQGFYGLVLMIFFGVVYNRTRSLGLCSILWLTLGGVWIAGAQIVSPIAVILVAFGLTGILYSVFARSEH